PDAIHHLSAKNGGIPKSSAGLRHCTLASASRSRYTRAAPGGALEPIPDSRACSLEERSMPVTLLDILLLAVMLLSGRLATSRRFMREVLSIASWAGAALVSIYAYPRLVPQAKQYFTSDLVATGVVVGGVFLATLIIVSIFTIKISDMVLDSRVGAL